MMMHARRARAVLSALALVAFALGATPLASPAASPTKAAAAKAVAAKKALTAAKKTTAKTALKKVSAKRVTGYHPHSGLAPADEYFGRLGMSVLGVRNKVKDLGIDADLHPDRDGAVLSGALWVEDAMRDWAKKYPFDRWLPRYAYALEQMYERIPGSDAHKRAVKQIAYLTAYFPQTVYGKVGRAKLAEGVPTPDPASTPDVATELERLALLDGKVTPTLPPAATPVPVAFPSQSPSTVPAAPSGAETPAPASTPAPVPSTPAPAASARP